MDIAKRIEVALVPAEEAFWLALAASFLKSPQVTSRQMRKTGSQRL